MNTFAQRDAFHLQKMEFPRFWRVGEEKYARLKTGGLTVTAVKESQTYPTGLKVTDEELAALNLVRDPFHGEWNSTITPQA